ncbi:tyrosine-type recombinase/integrase [Enterococcus sp. AZ072]|uniref:tyrosine-type recombinase/integrase n=1 Tax=unclassified Enterococcus TaxID=2608891 RepID=UPI003D2BE8A2
MCRRGENIYHRKDERWEGRYHKGRKANGRLLYGYVYGKTLEEVQEKLRPLKKNAELTLKFYGKSVVTFNEWSIQWLNELQATLKPATYASYLHKLKKYLWKPLGELPMYQLDAKAIRSAVDSWKVEGLACSSIKVFFRLLNQAMAYAIKQGMIERNPCESVDLPKAIKERVRALSLSEQRKLEKVVETDCDPRSKTVSLALRTGMRIGEIAALKWDAVDLERRLIYVNQTYQRICYGNGKKSELQLGPPKSQTSQRVIPMSDKVCSLLENLKTNTTADFVFTTKGKPCEPRLLTKHFHRILKKAKLIGIHFHQLRHTFATRCLEAEEKIFPVSRLLGHYSVQLTSDIYYDSQLGERIDVVTSMDKLVG